MMNIYIAPVWKQLSDVEFEKRMSMMPSYRRKKIKNCASRFDKLRGLCVGMLLEYGLQERGISLRPSAGKYRWESVEEAPTGKPYLYEKTVCFNLSHSGSYVAAVFDDDDVGIDIEQWKSAFVSKKIARRFFMQEEFDKLSAIEDEMEAKKMFAEVWTRKESYVKALGSGLRENPLNGFSVLEDGIGEYRFKTFPIMEGYSLSVCAKSAIDAEPLMVNPDKILFNQ